MLSNWKRKFRIRFVAATQRLRRATVALPWKKIDRQRSKCAWNCYRFLANNPFAKRPWHRGRRRGSTIAAWLHRGSLAASCVQSPILRSADSCHNVYLQMALEVCSQQLNHHCNWTPATHVTQQARSWCVSLRWPSASDFPQGRVRKAFFMSLAGHPGIDHPTPTPSPSLPTGQLFWTKFCGFIAESALKS